MKQFNSFETVQLLRLLGDGPLNPTLSSARQKLLNSEHLMVDCLNCGYTFEPSSPKAVTCSGACRTNLKRIRQGMRRGSSTRMELVSKRRTVTGRRLLKLAEGIPSE